MEFCKEPLGALEANDQATATEKIELKITYLNMISYGENTRKANLQEIADGLRVDKEMEYVKLKNQEIASLEPIDVTGESSIFVKLKEYPYEFEINEDLYLASVDGVKIADSSNNSISEEKINRIVEEKVNEKMQELEKNYVKVTDIERYATKEEVNKAISDSLLNSGLSMDTLYLGTAQNKGTYNFSFPQGKNLSNYKLLCFFTEGYSGAFGWVSKKSVLVEPVINNIQYSNADCYADEFDGWAILFSVNSSNSFRIGDIFLYGDFSAAKIYKVVGIY